MSTVISASLSPNTEKDDILIAVQTLFSLHRWGHGASTKQVEDWFTHRYQAEEVALFNSGRSALFAMLRAFDIGVGDEVIVQAFTCVAVPNSVIWAGAQPVFADIDETFNIDPNDVTAKISKKTKALIVQHTFGVPAQMDKLKKIAKKHSLVLIEDFAHSLGLPMSGDAAFFSFGRDKVVSSVWGGGAVISSKFKVQSSKLRQFHKSLKYPSNFWIFQQLLHPIAFSLILPLYDVQIGKLFLLLFQKLHLLSKPVYDEEYSGGMPKGFLTKYPNALAILLLNQLKKLERYNKNRLEIARFYAKKNVDWVYLRFPMLVDNPAEIIQKAKKNGVLLGNWYHSIIDPAGVDLEAVGYIGGSCPKAEEIARRIINLPTRITIAQARYVTKQINS